MADISKEKQAYFLQGRVPARPLFATMVIPLPCGNQLLDFSKYLILLRLTNRALSVS